MEQQVSQNLKCLELKVYLYSILIFPLTVVLCYSGNGDEEYEPPKAEVREIKEDGAVYTIR